MIAALTRPEAMRIAKNMRATGWSVRQIRSYLAARGQNVGHATIIRWTDPDYAERDRRRQAERFTEARLERGMSLARANSTYSPEFRLARLRALVEHAGLSHSGAARVMFLDFGDDLSRNHVEHALRVGKYPNMNRKRAGAKA